MAQCLDSQARGFDQPSRRIAFACGRYRGASIRSALVALIRLPGRIGWVGRDKPPALAHQIGRVRGIYASL